MIHLRYMPFFILQVSFSFIIPLTFAFYYRQSIFMNYKETLDFLYGVLPAFSRIGTAALKKDLTNTYLLCDQLGNPQNKFKSIHVAGTNGKGSVSHMLAAVLQTSGYKTGLYTSPHLRDFRERFRVDGILIEEDFVVSFTKKIIPLIDIIRPSFFEITVAMAFEYFSERQVDVAVIETGLGGRLDSTNIITPVLSVITNIGRDHMNVLGNTLEEIAYEKAGIIKPGVPAVIGESVPGTEKVFEAAAQERNSPLTWADRERHAESHRHINHNLSVEIGYTSDKTTHSYLLDLPGIYQVKNLITSLAAIDQLKEGGWNIPDEAVREGLQHVQSLTGLHGRWEIIHRQPMVVLDVGHNEDGIRQIVEHLKGMSYHALHIVMGMVKDKDITKVIQLLPKEAAYYFTKAPIPRALPEEELAAMAAANGLRGSHFPSVNIALQHALDGAGKDDLVLVCGSVFVVGEVDWKG